MIVLKQNGKEFRKWSTVDVNLNLNTVMSTFDLTAYRDENNKDLFSPFPHTECEIWLIDEERGINEKLISGVINNTAVSIQKKPRMSRVTGMSKTGIIVKASMPHELYPLQWSDVSVADIATLICDSFNLKLRIHPGAQDQAYLKFEEKVECATTETVYQFLSRICAERGITVSHDNEGRLLLYRILNVIPATSTIRETDNTVSVSIASNGQNMHTEVTVLKNAKVNPNEPEGENSENDVVNSYTAYSPFLRHVPMTRDGIVKNVKVPLTVKVKEDDSQSLELLANSIICKEARNFPIQIAKEGWDFEGRIVRAGFFLILDAPSLDINDEKFVVESMTFTKKAREPEQLNATLLLPCVYTGVIPNSVPYKSPIT